MFRERGASGIIIWPRTVRWIVRLFRTRCLGNQYRVSGKWKLVAQTLCLVSRRRVRGVVVDI